jgi:hypothetical protein
MQSFQKTSSNASRYQSFNEANRSTWMPLTLLNNRSRLSLKHSLLHFKGLPLGLRWLTYAIRTCLGGAETCPRMTFPRYWRARMSIIVWIVGILPNRVEHKYVLGQSPFCLSFGRGALQNNTLSIILHFNSLYLLLSRCDCFRPCI